MEEKIENINSPNDEEIVAPEENEPEELGLPADQPEVEPKDDAEEETEVLKQRNQELYEQLKKAKGLIRDQKTGKWVKKVQEPPKEVRIEQDITRQELYSLVKANVPDEDTQEVIDYARMKKISITEALKTPEVKAILGVRMDYRKTAEAANIGSSRYRTSKISDEALEQNASKGILPEDDEGISRLASLRAGKGAKQ